MTLQREFPRFQRAGQAVDAAAGAVLALSETDLRCIDLLQYGPMSQAALATALDAAPREISAALARLEAAGYVRPIASASNGGGSRPRALTEHAREWIESLWGPLRDEGARLLQTLSTRELESLVRFLEAGSALQERHAARIRALASLPASDRPRAVRTQGGLPPAALRRVQLYVLAHLDRRLSLDELAARAGVSRFHFSRTFRASTGETPYAFVQRLRVERAIDLLRDSDLPLGRIALACGYSSQSKLTHAVRRATGLTPARLRRSFK